MREESVKTQDLSDSFKVPKHVAIIMDGNRRWAKKRGATSSKGHFKGSERVEEIVQSALDCRVKMLTLFAFSTENWKRSKLEVRASMHLLEWFLKEKLKTLQKQGVKFETIGDLSKFSPKIRSIIQKTKDETKDCGDLTLILALNYGARGEIVRAMKSILEDVNSGSLSKEELTEKVICSYLDTSEYDDPDLLIRTGGESRLSNFLLWQLSYSEIYFSEVLWPEFTKENFVEALNWYQQRDRRFGR